MKIEVFHFISIFKKILKVQKWTENRQTIFFFTFWPRDLIL